MLEKDKYIHNDGGKVRVYHYVLFGVSVMVFRDDVITDRKKIKNEVRWMGTCKKTNGGHGDLCLAEGKTKKEVTDELNAYTQETFEKRLSQSETLTKWADTDVVIRKKGRLVLKARTRELIKYDSVTEEIIGTVEGTTNRAEHRLYLDGEHCGNLNITPTAIVELFKEDK